MRALLLVILTTLGAVFWGGCGASHSARPERFPTASPITQRDVISQAMIENYMNYALHFYSWADAGGGRRSALQCSTRAHTAACAILRQQVVRRLLEEEIIARYARLHAIRLSSADSDRVALEMKRLRSPGSGTRRLFSAERVSPHFMRRILRTQLLVKRIERAVTKKSALSGPSFRVRKYGFGVDGQSYQRAVDLATSGAGDKTSVAHPVHWVAAYRLSPHERSLLELAGPGDYVGPLRAGSSYIVIQVLKRGHHRYGLPARQEIQARTFEIWLSKQLSHIRLKCPSTELQIEPCTFSYH